MRVSKTLLTAVLMLGLALPLAMKPGRVTLVVSLPSARPLAALLPMLSVYFPARNAFAAPLRVQCRRQCWAAIADCVCDSAAVLNCDLGQERLCRMRATRDCSN